MPETGFLLNSKNIFEIETSPGIYTRLATGITNADPQPNEDVAQDKYLDGDGFAETDVLAAQLTLSFTGHRKYGDPAQDFIFSKFLELGTSRRTNFRWTLADGSKFEGPATIANITGPSGDAGAKGDIGFEIHFNGKPTYTAASGDTIPPTVTVVPADAATAVAIGSNIVWTFSEAIQSALVTDANFFVTTAADGTLVPGTLSINAGKTVVTFDPTANLAAATAYVAIATRNVKDLAGNALAANSVTNFTTA